MRLRIIVLTLAFLFLASLPADADEITLDEAPLPGGSYVYELNRGADGKGYATDLYGGQIWRIDPATGAYSRFGGLGMPQDARADSKGNIWYTDWSSYTFGRIGAGPNPQLTTWDLGGWDPVNHGRVYTLAGVAVDDHDWIWFSEYGEDSTDPKDPDQLLYRFNPNTNELCGYSLPDTGDHSYYVLYSGGYIWLGDWEQSRIVRFDPLDLGNTTYWDNDADVGQPRGLAVDPSDSIWWADTASNTIRRLHLTGAYENRITVYTPPVPGTPQMVALEGGKLWYTAQDVPTAKAGMRVLAPNAASGSIGILDPIAVPGTTGNPVTKRTKGSIETCHPLGAGITTGITPTRGELDWGSNTCTVASTGEAGWTVYQAAAYPYGIVAQADDVWVTDQWWQKVVDAFGLARPRVTISVPGGTTKVELAWGEVDDATAYHIWRSGDPYFTPDETWDHETGSLSFSDEGVAGNAGNYYYVVRAATGGRESASSNRTGAFAFSLTKGSG